MLAPPSPPAASAERTDEFQDSPSHPVPKRPRAEEDSDDDGGDYLPGSEDDASERAELPVEAQAADGAAAPPVASDDGRPPAMDPAAEAPGPHRAGQTRPRAALARPTARAHARRAEQAGRAEPGAASEELAEAEAPAAVAHFKSSPTADTSCARLHELLLPNGPISSFGPVKAARLATQWGTAGALAAASDADIAAAAKEHRWGRALSEQARALRSALNAALAEQPAAALGVLDHDGDEEGSAGNPRGEAAGLAAAPPVAGAAQVAAEPLFKESLAWNSGCENLHKMLTVAGKAGPGASFGIVKARKLAEHWPTPLCVSRSPERRSFSPTCTSAPSGLARACSSRSARRGRSWCTPSLHSECGPGASPGACSSGRTSPTTWPWKRPALPWAQREALS